MTDNRAEIHSICIDKNIPFATFRLPGQEGFTTYIQKSPQSKEWKSIQDITEKKGFIMAPFDTRNGKKYIMVKPDIVATEKSDLESLAAELNELPSNPCPEWDLEEPVVTEHSEYIDQVQTIKNDISRGCFQKSVLSRIKRVNGQYMHLITQIFEEVCRTHPNAFTYIFKSDSHFWVGASPEPLLRLSEGNTSTVSLAGTRSYSEMNMQPVNWTLKEVLEQEYVTKHIHDVLRAFKVRDYRVTSPYVKKAGDLVHLRTDFKFSFDQISSRVWDFLDTLHPTPAVAGQPKDEAVSYLKKLESHDREYYAGFLGPVVSDKRIDLFVNLRCMKITPSYLSLFVGGGITLESDPKDEWDETQLKARSLLNIIEKIGRQFNDQSTRKAAHN